MTMKLSSLLCAIVLTCTAPLGDAQGTQRTVVHAGHLLDVDSGKLLSDQAVTIVDGRVVSVQPWTTASGNGAKVLNWTTYTVVPGLMDMHTHLADEMETADYGAALKSNPARDAFIGAKNAHDTLRAGFTTVRDVGVFRGFADIALRDAINEIGRASCRERVLVAV